MISLNLKLLSKTKQLKTELITLVVDLGLGLLVILFTGFSYEIIVLSLSLLYLLYYSYVMTISYTRLGHNTEEMLRDLEKDTVDWRPNFDGTKKEPIVLPAGAPNLLCRHGQQIVAGQKDLTRRDTTRRLDHLHHCQYGGCLA